MERRHGAAKHVEGIWWLSSKGVNCWIFLNLAVNFYELVTIDYIYIYHLCSRMDSYFKSCGLGILHLFVRYILKTINL